MQQAVGAVDHRIRVVCIGCEMLRNLLPDSRFSPTADASMQMTELLSDRTTGPPDVTVFAVLAGPASLHGNRRQRE